MADAYCSSLADTWQYLQPFSDAFLFYDPFADQAVTRALQLSLSDSSSSTDLTPPPPTPLLHHLSQPAAAAAEFQAGPTKRASHSPSPAASGRVAKRKSRASKRSATTFIAADPANFRQMVQQVTGGSLAGGSHPPAEPLWAAHDGCGGLPTLDTSAFFLGGGPGGSVGPIRSVEAAAGFEFEPFPCFPTLESWSVM